MTVISDTEIIDLYFLRDKNAISYTSQKYGRSLRNIANNILSDPLSAEECENDTYLEAWNRIPPDEPRAYFFPYLAKIVRHLAIDLYRKRHRQKREGAVVELSQELSECLPGNGSVEDEVGRNLLVEEINRFLGTIETEKRSIFIRRYWFCETIEEISSRYRISESKVKTSLHRTRKALYEHLEGGGWL